MRLQTAIFPENDRGYPDMFVRGGKLKQGELFIPAEKTASLDTYFNSFSYTKYRRYTRAQKIDVYCTISGNANIHLCVYDGKEQIISSVNVQGAGNSCTVALLSAEINKLPENGYIYPKITANSDCNVKSCYYETECYSDEVKCGIAICTYKRESYVLRNVENLRAHTPKQLKSVFVIDNGKTLDTSISDHLISVLPNKNLGGSGGFTRGLIEALESDLTHIILMDDDIELYPEVIERIIAFISVLNKEHSLCWLSTAMLPFDAPWQQYELGARWNGNTSEVHKHLLDLRDKDALLDNLNNPDVQYGGWWSLCMPLESVRNIGLPYPFFIKLDDIEYGMRKPAECEIITMNGLAVYHERFDSKTSFILDYYNLRNALTVNAIYNIGGIGMALCRFWRSAMKQILLYRYDNFPLIVKAINDFLGGAEFYLNCDAEKINSELIAIAPKLSALHQQFDIVANAPKKKGSKIAVILTLGGHIIPSFATNKNVLAVPLNNTDPTVFYSYKTVIQYQGNSGILLQRNTLRFFSCLIKMFFTTIKLLCGYKKACRSLKNGKETITCTAFWKEKLGI